MLDPPHVSSCTGGMTAVAPPPEFIVNVDGTMDAVSSVG
jgi:hypothetical protein